MTIEIARLTKTQFEALETLVQAALGVSVAECVQPGQPNGSADFQRLVAAAVKFGQMDIPVTKTSVMHPGVVTVEEGAVIVKWEEGDGVAKRIYLERDPEAPWVAFSTCVDVWSDKKDDWVPEGTV